MPTKKSWAARWQSERYFEDNSQEDGYNVRGSAMAGSGLDNPSIAFTGETIGTISIDPVTKDIVITPFPPEESQEK
jgi:hypothetical protein